MKIGGLKIFIKLARKHLYQSLFLCYHILSAKGGTRRQPIEETFIIIL